jgi:multiple sugar transport system permease protein
MMLLLQVVGTMQVFTEPYVITGSANGTTSVVYLIYQYAFNYNNYGSASALGVLLLLVLIAFAGAYLWLGRRLEEGK